ncbi:hypothetical protein PGT21_031058 [Puccinia graminis f. sp. tritici]|uniref:Uncharacterized protein n=1 Tax=Puccinia graminis f. sp. tritici TaxID=56615 RepID=A0A5B0QXP7_PUCGR|nr:hypothetical protein PGT21_031058 [Puccinia graminis f. sp. tritici]
MRRYPYWLLGRRLTMHCALSVLLLALVQTLLSTDVPSETNVRSKYRRLKPRSSLSESRMPNVLSNSIVNNPGLNVNQNLTTATHDDAHLLCQSRPLTPSLWKKLGMNSYLDNYPKGKDLSLEVRYSYQLPPVHSVEKSQVD